MYIDLLMLLHTFHTSNSRIFLFMFKRHKISIFPYQQITPADCALLLCQRLITISMVVLYHCHHHQHCCCRRRRRRRTSTPVIYWHCSFARSLFFSLNQNSFDFIYIIWLAGWRACAHTQETKHIPPQQHSNYTISFRFVLFWHISYLAFG